MSMDFINQYEEDSQNATVMFSYVSDSPLIVSTKELSVKDLKVIIEFNDRRGCNLYDTGIRAIALTELDLEKKNNFLTYNYDNTTYAFCISLGATEKIYFPDEIRQKLDIDANNLIAFCKGLYILSPIPLLSPLYEDFKHSDEGYNTYLFKQAK
jgi:hypothetical protein